jgi:hypothetical protein
MALLGGIANTFLKQLATGDSIHDWQHASRTFIDGLYRLSPKIGTVYHVFMDLNPTVAKVDQNSQIEIGMLAKTVALPRFTVTNKIYNAYNRKNIAQEKINYDPLTITFHDDSADVVRNFWYGYYAHYYRDSDHNEALYGQEHKYKKRQEQNWGYTPLTTQGTPSYINAIRIYSLHQKRFSSYTLIRPLIQSFQHGQHQAGEYTPMEHTMTVAYEAVKYAAGSVSNGTVLGFDTIHYDNSPSPLTSIGGGTTSILGPGGLVEGISDVVENLENGNFLGAALGGLRTTNNFKNTNLKRVATGELATLGRNILSGQNPLSSVFVPTAATVNQGLAKSVSSIPGLGGIVNTNNINSQNNQTAPSNQRLINL